MDIAGEVVVGATRKIIQVQLIDPITGLPLSFGSSPTVRLQGTSLDLPSKTLDVVGTIHDSGNAICWWTSAGTMITSGDMAGRTSATYSCRVKVLDGSGNDWGPLFGLLFSMPPAV